MHTMYEVSWHYKNDTFSHCTVTPITVLREGVLPGCTAPSITAVDAKGETFRGSAKDFFSSEAAAWQNVREEIQKTIEANDKALADLKENTFRLHRYLCSLPGD